MKQLPLPAHPVFPSRLDSIAALPELLHSRQIGCVLVIGDAHAVDCESLLLPVLEVLDDERYGQYVCRRQL